VLVVDDDDLIRGSLEDILLELGHVPSLAATGEEALAGLEAGRVPDLVILDLNMPGLGGGGTLPRLRALHPDLPVLLATGRTDEAARDLVRTFPPVTLIAKPFALKELRQAIQGLALGGRGVTGP